MIHEDVAEATDAKNIEFERAIVQARLLVDDAPLADLVLKVRLLNYTFEDDDNDKATWIADFSDHALLKFTVTGTNGP